MKYFGKYLQALQGILMIIRLKGPNIVTTSWFFGDLFLTCRITTYTSKSDESANNGQGLFKKNFSAWQYFQKSVFDFQFIEQKKLYFLLDKANQPTLFSDQSKNARATKKSLMDLKCILDLIGSTTQIFGLLVELYRYLPMQTPKTPSKCGWRPIIIIIS